MQWHSIADIVSESIHSYELQEIVSITFGATLI